MSPAEFSFGQRLSSAFSGSGQLCVGIDPHAQLLMQWGLEDSPRGVEEFGLRVVDAAAGRVGVVKPQVAFFERHGAAGFSALERVIGAARSAGLIVIADAKRGDVGSTMSAYAESWLLPGSPLEVDALTVSPYLGVGALEGTFALALEHGKGVFVLAATSNPEARELQSAGLGGRNGQSVASSIVNDVIALNSSASADLGSFGVVLGATVDLVAAGIDRDSLASTPATPVLGPGFGAQGATLSEVHSLFGAAARCTLVAVSRSLLVHGPDGLAEAIGRESAELAECLA